MTGIAESMLHFGKIVNGAEKMQQELARRQAVQDQELRQKCTEFEALLYARMLESMRKTVPKDGLFNAGTAEDIYTSMLDGEYAKMMAQSKQSTLAETMYRQMTKHKEDKQIQIDNNKNQQMVSVAH